MSLKHPAQKISLQEYIDAVHESTERVKRLNEQISLAVEEWRMAPVVKALQSLRGVSLITAAITVAELGDIARFQHPKELMAYLGLVPSEHSSGESIKRGHITKTGNSHARRVLVESAWTYKHHARVTSYLIKRQRDFVITSYSIHYTKLYEVPAAPRGFAQSRVWSMGIFTCTTPATGRLLP